VLTEKEKASRKGKVTGSKIGAIITGLFGGATAVYHKETGSLSDEIEETKPMMVGNALEPVIRRLYVNETGFAVEEISTIYAKCNPLHAVHIDGKITDPTGNHTGPGVLESKTAHGFSKHEWADGPPDYPLIQCLWGKHCTGYTWGVIAVMSEVYDLKYWEIERDDALIQTIVGHADHFLTLLETGTPPEVDGSPATTEVIKSVYRHASADGIMETMDTDQARDAATRLHRVKIIEKLAGTEKRRLENVFKMHIQDNQGCHIPRFGNITWKNTKPNASNATVDIERLLREFPDVYAQCLHITSQPSHRAFLVKPDKAFITDSKDQGWLGGLDYLKTKEDES